MDLDIQSNEPVNMYFYASIPYTLLTRALMHMYTNVSEYIAYKLIAYKT